MNSTPSILAQQAERAQDSLFVVNMSKRVFLKSEFEKNNSYFLSFLIFALFFEFQRKVQNHFFLFVFSNKVNRKKCKKFDLGSKKPIFFQKKKYGDFFPFLVK
jgi:hypothetical protein